MLVAARQYVGAGFSVIPILPGGGKKPAGQWKAFQSRRAGEEELAAWFAAGRNGVAILGGKVSGGLEVIDFDHGPLWKAFAERVEAEAPGLLARLPQVATPRKGGGRHLYYRCPEIKGNLDLAFRPPSDDEAKGNPNLKRIVTIQTRGEGGYVVAPGSPADCHETKGEYRRVAGPSLLETPEVTPLEREVLFTAARGLSEWVDPRDFPPAEAGPLRPGDDYDRRGPDWAEILTPHGWSLVRQDGAVRFWARPGKTGAWSADTGFMPSRGGCELLRVFSSNAHPLEAGRSYGKFRTLAVLQFQGNLSECAKALARQGYGDQARNGRHTVDGRSADQPRPAPEPPPWEPPIPLDLGLPADPFPLGVLPAPVRAYVEEVAWAVNCPADFPGMAALAVASGAIGNTFRLAITRTHDQPAVLFLLLIGAPGSGKSPALAAVVRPMERAQQRFYLQHQQAADRGETAVMRKCMVDDVTTESLIEALSQNPRGVLMVKDELSALIAGMNQYREGGKGNDRQLYLKLWATATIKRDRVHLAGVTTRVYLPFVSIVGGIPPGVVADMRSQRGGETVEDGFLDRFQACIPEPMPAVKEQWREVSAQAEERWRAAVDVLLDMPLATNDDGTPRPVEMPLTAAGRRAWEAFTADHAAEVNAKDFPAHLVGPWSKLRGVCGRLALVLRLLWEAAGEPLRDGGSVGGADVERAAKLTAYFKSHTRKVYGMLARDTRVEAARVVLAWLNGWDQTTFRRSDLWRSVRHNGAFGRPEDLDRPLTLLEQHGYIRPAPGEEVLSRIGRKPTQAYEINPVPPETGPLNPLYS